MKRILSILLCLVLMTGMLSGCGGDSAIMEAAPGYAADSNYAESPKEVGKGSLTSGTELKSVPTSDRKLIKTVRISAETETFTDLLLSLDERITQLGGYIESRELSSSHRRYCSMIIRIPANALEGFVAHVREHANVTSSSETAEDVTLEYVDTEAKITALETEQKRLLELLAEANSLEDILTIEDRLSDVTYELERYASRLRTLSNLVDYATVNLTVYEVEVLTPMVEPTVWQRITDGFSDTIEDLAENLTDLFVWVIVESPNLLIFALFIWVVVIIVRKIRGRGKPRKQRTIPTPPENQPE